jgi:PPK2 family polyphosphate:nucleotide phosphotransferase
MDPHLHRLPPGPVDLTALATDDTSGFDGGKSSGKQALVALGDELSDLQERLFAERTTGSGRRVLLVLQGMDTSGKGGVLRHTVGLVDPQGLKITSFKAPTDEERKHRFLWRIRNALPPAGYIGVFDRSHYEDVLVVRVHELVPESEWRPRYELINEFEAELVAAGTTVLKCFLNISFETQRTRLLARLDDPDKHWKFNEGDVDERARWSDYQAAYSEMLERCNTPLAPWYIVPSDHKKYRNWAVGELLRETLADLDPKYPRPALDVPTLRSRLAPPH